MRAVVVIGELAAAGCGGGVAVAPPLDDPPVPDGTGAAVMTTNDGQKQEPNRELTVESTENFS